MEPRITRLEGEVAWLSERLTAERDNARELQRQINQLEFWIARHEVESRHYFGWREVSWLACGLLLLTAIFVA